MFKTELEMRKKWAKYWLNKSQKSAKIESKKEEKLNQRLIKTEIKAKQKRF